MFFIYSMVYTAAALILFFPQYLKRPLALRRKWLRNKFGIFDLDPAIKAPVWVHAVSVGEVTAAIPFLNRLKADHPALPVIVSTITDTGQNVAMAKMPPGTTVVYMPFDIGFILRRCLARVGPRLFIVVETEIWPGIFRAVSERGAAVIMLNGRLSEKSCRGYRLLPHFMKRVLGYVSLFGMQDKAAAGRMERIGADSARIFVTGNFKFDTPGLTEVPLWAKAMGSPLIIAGSTHAGEEDLVISAFRENRERFPDLGLVLAPRHPERFSEVEDLLRKSGIPFIKRTDIDELRLSEYRTKRIVLLDSIGELSAVYGAGDIAVIGKSFLGYGGQNPLEPALLGKAIICGPHMENFSFMSEFYENGAAFQVEQNGLAKMIRNLLTEPEKAQKAGIRARELSEKNAGAVQRSLEIIKQYL
ncbi:MAG: 3-deoxy-D-manno-octulosonic acid transferase [Thermodesulfovibrionales bacterium]